MSLYINPSYELMAFCSTPPLSRLSVQCLKQYLALLIQEGVVTNITCPDASCKESGKIQANEVSVAESIYTKIGPCKL